MYFVIQKKNFFNKKLSYCIISDQMTDKIPDLRGLKPTNHEKERQIYNIWFVHTTIHASGQLTYKSAWGLLTATNLILNCIQSPSQIKFPKLNRALGACSHQQNWHNCTHFSQDEVGIGCLRKDLKNKYENSKKSRNLILKIYLNQFTINL